MDTGGTRELVVVYEGYSWTPDNGANRLVRNADGYYALYRQQHLDEGQYYPDEYWHSLQEMAILAVSLHNRYSLFRQSPMCKFIHGYVGEERWILAVLETM